MEGSLLYLRRTQREPWLLVASLSALDYPCQLFSEKPDVSLHKQPVISQKENGHDPLQLEVSRGDSYPSQSRNMSICTH